MSSKRIVQIKKRKNREKKRKSVRNMLLFGWTKGSQAAWVSFNKSPDQGDFKLNTKYGEYLNIG